MRSQWQGKNHHQNATSLLKFWHNFKRFRSFYAQNLESIGQRAAKLPAIKLWEWFEFARVWIRADWFKWGRGSVADFFLRPLTLTASIFADLWPTDPILIVWKVLNPFERYTTSSRAQLLSVCFINNVYKQRFFRPVKFFAKSNNRTSQIFCAKQQMKIS